MTTDRVYRPAIGADAARAELELGAGTQFDVRVVRAFLAALDRPAPEGSNDAAARGARGPCARPPAEHADEPASV